MADSDLGGDREDGRSTMGIVAYANESFCYGASKTIKAVVINTTRMANTTRSLKEHSWGSGSRV
jgi:hypothetical protein